MKYKFFIFFYEVLVFLIRIIELILNPVFLSLAFIVPLFILFGSDGIMIYLLFYISLLFTKSLLTLNSLISVDLDKIKRNQVKLSVILKAIQTTLSIKEKRHD